jgi:predicted metal-dependent phosphoesterase TrpH
VQYKIDLHTHSVASPDGGLALRHYQRMLESGRLDGIAITDHNTIDMAKQIHATLGDRIIIGEEVTTLEGEIIGLYLKRTIPPLLSVAETIQRIHEQGGLVYVPHPFETVRKGLSRSVLATIAKEIDIIECHNGRAIFQDRSKTAKAWQQAHAVVGAASSDAHGHAGWGKTYSTVAAMPTRDTLVGLLGDATYTVGFPGFQGMAYPKYYRLRKWNWSIR